MARYLTRRTILIAGVCILIGVGSYHVYKPIPDGLSYAGTVHTLDDRAVTFLADRTYIDDSGARVSDQVIFDTVFALIDDARSYVLLDMFLYNTFMGNGGTPYRPLASELTDHLVTRAQATDTPSIIVITDPINEHYGGLISPLFTKLRSADIPVITTALDPLRDSNPVYSSIYRTILAWPDRLHRALFDTPYTVRAAPNLMDTSGERVTLRSYLSMFNFKANHRKLIVTDRPDGTFTTLVTSANPHDGSSAHGNVAIKIEGPIATDAMVSERAVGALSGDHVPLAPVGTPTVSSTSTLFGQLLTEQEILLRARAMIDATESGDTIELMMFYLSEESLVASLARAAQRGVTVRIILDPNKDAFGREKNGIPNRSIAAHLLKEGGEHLEVRWCATHGEQCHAKLLIVTSAQRGNELLLGSANFTRRNLGGYNLETDVWLGSETSFTAYRDARSFFATTWESDGSTTAYETYEDTSRTHAFLAWFMERTGLSTF